MRSKSLREVWNRFRDIHKWFGKCWQLKLNFFEAVTANFSNKGIALTSKALKYIVFFNCFLRGNTSVMRPFVWSSHVHKTPLQIRASSLFYLMHVLYHPHQLFNVIERENILCVLDRASFIEILAMINLYYWYCRSFSLLCSMA